MKKNTNDLLNHTPCSLYIIVAISANKIFISDGQFIGNYVARSAFFMDR